MGDVRSRIEALVFVVFGTVVDWREGVARDLGAFLARHELRGLDRMRSPTPGAIATSLPCRSAAPAGVLSRGSMCCIGRTSTPSCATTAPMQAPSTAPNSMH
jgi:hypothetical protein